MTATATNITNHSETRFFQGDSFLENEKTLTIKQAELIF